MAGTSAVLRMIHSIPPLLCVTRDDYNMMSVFEYLFMSKSRSETYET